MNHPDTPINACCDEEYVLPSVEALMAGYAQAAAGDLHRSLLARKLVSNLFFLSEHPQVSPHMRCMLANLRTRWQLEVEQGGAPRCVPAPTPLWHSAPEVLQ